MGRKDLQNRADPATKGEKTIVGISAFNNAFRNAF